MSETAGFSIQIFFPSGNPEEAGVIQRPDRATKGLIFPRTLLRKKNAELLQREEFSSTGIYILWEICSWSAAWEFR